MFWSGWSSGSRCLNPACKRRLPVSFSAFAFRSARRAGGDVESPLRQLEHRLRPWVAYLILPLFALLNAGVSFSGTDSDAIIGNVPLGIVLGLFVGKQFGVFVMVWLLIRCGLCRMPEGGNWRQLYGVAGLTGIGFTMSLFIGSLAFEAGTHDGEIRIGVLMGSIVSAVIGYVLLRAAGQGQSSHRTSTA